MDTNKGPEQYGDVVRTGGLIDITLPAATDTQTCRLRVLQYLAIIWEAFAQSPVVLREGGEALQQFIVDVVLPQLQQVNLATTQQYYEAVRAKLHQPIWVCLYKCM